MRSATGFVLDTYAWDGLDPGGRAELVTLLAPAGLEAPEFCSLYFDRFHLVHRLGEVLLDVAAGGIPPAEREYLANLFALKYFQNKGETGYIETLCRAVQALLDAYSAHFAFDVRTMNDLYPRYRRDLRTLAAFHFNAFRRCLGDPRTLEELVRDLSGRTIERLNPYLILRRGLGGDALVNECLQLVFEFAPSFPEVQLRPRAALSVDDFSPLQMAPGLAEPAPLSGRVPTPLGA